MQVIFDSAMIRRHLSAGWLAIVALILLVAAAPAGAQPAIRLDVTPFMDGLVKHGEWLPLRVRLENDGAGTTVRVQVPVRRSATGRDVYARTVELPRGARKEIALYVMSNTFSQSLTVQVLPTDENDPLLTRDVAVTPVENIVYTVGIVRGDTGGDGLDPLSTLEVDRPEIRIVTIPLTSLPDRFEGLRSLDLLVVTGVDTSGLSSAQQDALTLWVNQGGVLALGGGLDADGVLAGLPGELQPVDVQREAILETLPAFADVGGEEVRVSGPFLAARAEPRDAATVRVEQDGLPLVVEERFGRGSVLWLALDPAQPPFDAWAGTDEFWSGLLAPYAAYPRTLPPDVSPRRFGEDQIAWALNNLPSLELPSLGLLVPLLAVYIVVVGPLNYFLLRRRRRLELAWITIPALTVAFSAGAYGFGLSARGTDAILHQISVVEPVPATDLAVARTYVGVFSPARRSYRTHFSNDVLIETLTTDQFGARRDVGAGALTVQQGAPTVVEGLAVDQWTLRALAGDTVVRDGYGFDAALVAEEERIVGTVRNRSSTTIRDAAVVVGGEIDRLGDLAPGAVAEVTVAAPTTRRFEPLAFRLLSDTPPDSGRREVELKRQILNAVFDQPVGRETGEPEMSVMLVGWADDAPVTVRLGDTSPTVMQTTLVRAPLRVALEETVPVGMVPGRLLTPAAACHGPQGADGITLNGGQAEYAFYLPPDVADTVRDLRLSLDREGSWTPAPEIQVWNTQTQAWDTLEDGGWGDNRIAAEAHVASGGEVRVRLVAAGGNPSGCLFLRMGTQGERS